MLEPLRHAIGLHQKGFRLERRGRMRLQVADDQIPQRLEPVSVDGRQPRRECLCHANAFPTDSMYEHSVAPCCDIE